MVSYVIGASSCDLFDPAVGAGAFFVAARRLAARRQIEIRLLGTEIHPDALAQAESAGLNPADIAGVEIRDFVLDSPDRQFPAIVANPPYIRHHRIGKQTKDRLRQLSKEAIGSALDGRTGYHIFFFIRALRSLINGGRLAFIMPADACEGIFATTLWKWVLTNYRLDAVITFASGATPFPGVDTNAVVFMIRAEVPSETFVWAQCKEASPTGLHEWVEGGFPIQDDHLLQSVCREVEEGFRHGLSRPPRAAHGGPVLGDFVRVVRGIATGDNDFFFMTGQQASSLNLPRECLVRAIGRTRDIDGDELEDRDIEALDEGGRPTYLLSLDGKGIDSLNSYVREYLRRGEQKGTPKRALIGQRRPWYKMEKRAIPPFLFAYLGRRNVRFIRNRAGVVPLTGFLCIYPLQEGEDALERTWRLLSHPDTVANLSLVGKSYGSGAIKVEPRALERVPITDDALRSSGAQASLLQIGMAFVGSA
jgi:adenine-specific DNA-methyltransferase